MKKAIVLLLGIGFSFAFAQKNKAKPVSSTEILKSLPEEYFTCDLKKNTDGGEFNGDKLSLIVKKNADSSYVMLKNMSEIAIFEHPTLHYKVVVINELFCETSKECRRLKFLHRKSADGTYTEMTAEETFHDKFDLNTIINHKYFVLLPKVGNVIQIINCDNEEEKYNLEYTNGKFQKKFK